MDARRFAPWTRRQTLTVDESGFGPGSLYPDGDAVIVGQFDCGRHGGTTRPKNTSARSRTGAPGDLPLIVGRAVSHNDINRRRSGKPIAHVIPPKRTCWPNRKCYASWPIVVKGGRSIDGDSYGITVNTALLVALPPGVVIVIFPVVAVAGTVRVTCVSEFVVNEVTFPLPTVMALV